MPPLVTVAPGHQGGKFVLPFRHNFGHGLRLLKINNTTSKATLNFFHILNTLTKKMKISDKT